MTKNLFETFAEISTLAEVDNLNYQFEDYKLVYFDSPWNEQENCTIKKEWYIMGTNVKELTGVQRINDSSILVSLINLASLIIQNNGLYDKDENMDELSFSEDIIEWCKKYGLPYIEEYFRQNYPKDKSSIPSLGYCAFRIWEFKRRICLLHDHFNLWYGLAFEDMKKTIEYSIRIRQIDLNKNIDTQISTLKEYLAYKIWNSMDANLSMRYNKNTDSYSVIPYSDNLISVAYFHLAMLMTNKGMKGVRFCSMCNQLFEIEHGSTKICSNCKREYHAKKTRECRARNRKSKNSL